MNTVIKTFPVVVCTGLVALLALPVFAQVSDKETLDTIVGVEAVVTAVDPESSEVSLWTLDGHTVTLDVPDIAIKHEDVYVGDSLVVGPFYAATDAELRAPTEEELAEPWRVLEEGAIPENSVRPSADTVQLIRAVVTIEDKDRETGAIAVRDSRGALHFIADVNPKKMASLAIGQLAVVIFAETMVLTWDR